MKEEKLFKMVESVDDDLICEMMEYSPDVKAKGGEYEGVLYSAGEKVRKVHYWKYPAAAAVLMLAIVGVLFIFNTNSTLPYEEGGSFASTVTTHYPALDLLNCRPDEDGKYRVDEDFLTATDDYELFRKYFFGTWEGSFDYAGESRNQDTLIIDDSLKSFNMTEKNIWYNQFYKVGNNVLAFVCGGAGYASEKVGGPTIYWLDMNDPGTMYIAWGDVGEYDWLWSMDENGNASSTPAVYSLIKSDIPPNEPEENFLSIFRMYEMSRDHGIDFELLVDFDFGYLANGEDYLLAHNGYHLFYPVYLISENGDRLEFRTKVGTGLDEQPLMDVSYTLEKIDGNWTRALEPHYERLENDPYTPVDTNIPYEFTEEDKELQKFLSETANEAAMYQSLYDGGYFGGIGFQIEGDQEHEGIISARFPQSEEALDKQISCSFMLLSDELPFKTRAELEACLKQYYSAEIVSGFMASVGVGKITQYTEDDCLIEITENGYFDDNGFLIRAPQFIEINGRLYRDEGAKGGWFTPNWSMAKVISKTDEEIIFSYLGYGMDDIKEIRAGLGRLKYEDGWKYDWSDIITPYEMVDFEEVWGA